MTKIAGTRKLKTAAIATTIPRPWTRDEVERIIAWMEDHEEEIRGKQVQWHKEVKEQVFADEEHIPVKRITEKMGSMRKAWKGAKAGQKRSGWGVKPKENEESINEVLERKCPGFTPKCNCYFQYGISYKFPNTLRASVSSSFRTGVPMTSCTAQRPICALPLPPPLPHHQIDKNILQSQLQHPCLLELELFLTFEACVRSCMLTL